MSLFKRKRVPQIKLIVEIDHDAKTNYFQIKSSKGMIVFQGSGQPPETVGKLVAQQIRDEMGRDAPEPTPTHGAYWGDRLT